MPRIASCCMISGGLFECHNEARGVLFNHYEILCVSPWSAKQLQLNRSTGAVQRLMSPRLAFRADSGFWGTQYTLSSVRGLPATTEKSVQKLAWQPESKGYLQCGIM